MYYTKIKLVIIESSRNFGNTPWYSFLESCILELFPISKRPKIVHSYDKDCFTEMMCYQEIVVTSSWKDDGKIFSEPLDIDLIRASVYKAIGWQYKPKQKNNKLTTALIIRKRVRKILNLQSIDEEVTKQLLSKVLNSDVIISID